MMQTLISEQSKNFNLCAKGKHCCVLGMRPTQLHKPQPFFGDLVRNCQEIAKKKFGGYYYNILYLPSCIWRLSFFEKKVTSMKFGGHSLYLFFLQTVISIKLVVVCK